MPASSFCEPDTGKPAKWHWFAVNGEHDRELFAFAGIWQRWTGPIKNDGPSVELNVYAFMTTKPNALTTSINHERMPVLLSGEDQFETWLSGSSAEAFNLATSFDPARMRIVQSGTDREALLGQGRSTAENPLLLYAAVRSLYGTRHSTCIISAPDEPTFDPINNPEMQVFAVVWRAFGRRDFLISYVHVAP